MQQNDDHDRDSVMWHLPVVPWLTRHARGCRVQLSCAPAPDERVYVRAEPDNEELFIEMRRVAPTMFEADIPWDAGNFITVYCFRLQREASQVWLAADGMHPHIPQRDVHFRVCRDHVPPSWVKHQIAYQIFADRFHQADPTLAVRTDEYRYRDGSSRVVKRAWGEPVPHENMVTTFYGGDLAGIEQKLDYLHETLGVTMLYLNPIFASGSNHRYDTDDYFNVDPHLGGNAALTSLVDALRARGMRVLLDAVLNHTSDDHRWFNRWGRHGDGGAYQDTASPTRAWYCLRDSGEFVGWKGFDSLPVLDLSNPELQTTLYAGERSVLRHWMRAPYRIDGWRVDVAHMLGEGEGARNNAHYMRAFRRVMHEENAQTYLLGEQFNEATRWLQGDQQDGAMNYFGFTHPLRAWLAKVDINGAPLTIDTPTFAAWLRASRARIPYENQLAQLNLLDSHDTARFYTLLNKDVDAMRIAVALLFTYPGVPSIYYGDEIGMEGGRDPDCRRCFDWDNAHWNQTIFDTYRRLIALRRQRAELQEGAYVDLVAANDLFVFARVTARAMTLVAVNVGATETAIQWNPEHLPFVPRAWSPALDAIADRPDRIGGRQVGIWVAEDVPDGARKCSES
jgi:alpha-glucosidase